MDVYVITPKGDYVHRIESLGAKHIPVAIKRFTSPFADIMLLLQLYNIFRKEKFDIVHNMTIKPNIYGTFAAKMAKIKKVVCLVSGGGFAYAEDLGVIIRLLKFIIDRFYKYALNLSDKTWFQNSDDKTYFVKKGLLPEEKSIVIRSGGINTMEYSISAVSPAELSELRNELRIPPAAQCVVMISARMIWSKGVREFIEAAHMLQDKFPAWVFLMVCPRDPDSPDAVADDYIKINKRENLFIIDYFRPDIKKFVAISEIMVLPSYYREGVPRTLLEGLSMGKSIVTTENVGCREVVEEGRNGFLVPVKDSNALADKIRILMDDDIKRKSFGEVSREIARRDFDETIIVDKIMTQLYGI